MSTAPVNEYVRILEQVRSWPPKLRINLAQDLLRSLADELHSDELRGVPGEQVLGLAASQEPPPDDDMVRRWIEEHRQEKYG